VYPLKVSGSLHSPPAQFSFKDKPVPLGSTVRLFTSCHYGITLNNKHNTTDPMYRLHIQHCHMFQLSTSGIIRVASVHTKNKKLERTVSTNRGVKLLIVTNIIPYKKSNYMKECIRNFPVTIQCIGSNTKLERNII